MNNTGTFRDGKIARPEKDMESGASHSGLLARLRCFSICGEADGERRILPARWLLAIAPLLWRAAARNES
jgi:hypothetical protein